MIYERNFTGPSLKTHLPSRRHALGSAAPRKLSKLTAELSRLTFAPLIGGVTRLKYITQKPLTGKPIKAVRPF